MSRIHYDVFVSKNQVAGSGEVDFVVVVVFVLGVGDCIWPSIALLSNHRVLEDRFKG